MKKIIIFSILAVFTISSCKEYLEVVPDDTETLETIYGTRESAWNGLSKVYSYLPIVINADYSPWILGDEYFGKKLLETDATRYLGMRVMRGFNSEQSPILGYWSGGYGCLSLYEGIRQCNIFLEHIHFAVDMTDEERTDWSAQVKFMKAYYHFLLMQQYGPIVIRDKSISLYATKEELYVDRSKLEECFDYVIKAMDEAIPHLKEQAVLEDAGQIDQIGAKAIKARVLLFRASPFYNGNTDYYSTFLDHDKKHFFPQTYDPEKWKAVIDACDDALELCNEYHKGLYTFEGEPYRFDRDAFDRNGQRMKTLYDLRMLIITPWNKELLWGYSDIQLNNGEGAGGRNMLHSRSQVRFWEVMQTVYGAPAGYWGDNDDCENHANQVLCATYAMVERYYTQNGLPLSEDLDFYASNKYTQWDVPEESNPDYDQWAGIMQPDIESMYIYRNRELRFYANLGVTGSYWRGHYFLIPLNMYQSTAKDQPLKREGKNPVYQFGGKENWRKKEDYFETCIGIQKFVHPESYSGNWTRLQRYPYPLIRYADLLLMKAEALNEYEGPSQKVYDLLNQVRQRAGIPNVEESWGTSGKARTPNKHLDQSGLRDIILQERGIELSFEGSRFYDMLRHKRAPKEFSQPVYGWNPLGAELSEQMGSGPQLKQLRNFTITNCLWPISTSEMNIQGGLIQNPGWK